MFKLDYCKRCIFILELTSLIFVFAIMMKMFTSMKLSNVLQYRELDELPVYTRSSFAFTINSDDYTNVEYIQWIQFYSKEKVNNECFPRKQISNRLNAKYISNYTMENNMLVIDVNESFRGVSSSGGATFNTTCETYDEIWNCDYTDTFNGRYRITCPLSKKGETKIKIDALYDNFNPFKRYKSIRNNKFDIVNKKFKVKPNKIAIIGQRPETIWKRRNNNWFLKEFRKIIFPWPGKLSNQYIWLKEFCKRYSVIIVIGSSHARYKFNLLVQECIGKKILGKTIRFHRSKFIKNIHFIWSTKSDDFINSLANVTKIINKIDKSDKRPILFLEQSGSHDTSKCNIANTLFCAIPKLVDHINDLKTLSFIMNRKMVVGFITAPPISDSLRENSRNNVVLSVLAQYLSKELLSIQSSQFFKLYYYDEFAILKPMRKYTDCDVYHYICRKGPNAMVTGNVGIRAFLIMLKMLPII